MRLTAFLLMVFCQVSAGTNAQVSYSASDLPLDVVFSQLRKQTGYDIFYKDQDLVGTRKVTFRVVNATIEEVMKKCVEDQPLEFTMQGKNVFIKRKVDPGRITGAESNSGKEEIVKITVRGRLHNKDNEPVVGATIQEKGTNKMTVSNEMGLFVLADVDEKATLVISSVNYQIQEIKLNGREEIIVALSIKSDELEEVVIPFNTGYYTLPGERATGAYSYVDQKLFNRSTSGNIINRIENVTNGLLVNSNATGTGARYNLTVRGQSTLSPLVNKDVLIVVNGFPYEGDINSINPNDIASVTLLKDAAAASIWGARSGNGVLVITTKNGGYNKRFAIEANMNMTVSSSPDLDYDKKYVGASTYVEIEQYLFQQGYYTQRLADKTTFPWVTPTVELLESFRKGEIGQNALNSSLDSLKRYDVRSDAKSALYQASIGQQYAVNMSGGSQNVAYYLGLGYDRTRESLVRNKNDRFTVTSINTFTPVKNLELTGSLIYSSANTYNNNTIGWGASANSVSILYPYAGLKDANGQPLDINYGYRDRFVDSVQALGFMDWRYRPLQELALADNRLKTTSLTMRATAKYNFTPALSLQVNFQNEKQTSAGKYLQDAQSYAARNEVNRFSVYNKTNGTFTYPFPKGGILRNTNAELVSNNLRALLEYRRSFGEHSVNAIAGAEIRQAKSSSYDRVSYGYNPLYGSSVTAIDYVTIFPTNGGTPAAIVSPPGATFGTTQRFISYYANAAYSYKQRYAVTLSGRKDGANVFGVRANDRVTPLWSAGLLYDISKEDFYRIAWLPTLKFRGTYGFNGNVYNGSAYLTAFFGGVNTISNLTYGTVTTAPNPELRWERVRNINFGVDFAMKNDILRGSLDYYIKNGLDLVQDMELAPSTGFPSFRGNSASTSTRGLELMLTSTNINRALRWTTTFIFNYNYDKVRDYQAVISPINLVQSFFGNLYPGNYILGLYSYRSGGIDAANGDPIGYLNKTPSKDYAAIVSNTKVEDLVYHGSARPLVFGAVRNAFSYKRFSVSANITYRLKYYFRRPTVGLNYQTLFGFGGGMHQDYLRRWTKPGDELTSKVPSLQYVTNDARNNVYKFSEVNVEKGDHIRLADIAFGYEVPTGSRSYLKNLQVYGFINNVGLLWKANDAGLDPDFTMDYSMPRATSFSLGVRANF